MTEKVECVWVIRGIPKDASAAHYPVTVHDLRSRRLRYQFAPFEVLAPLWEQNGIAKFRAVWKSHEGTNGRWDLIDVLPNNVTVMP